MEDSDEMKIQGGMLGEQMSERMNAWSGKRNNVK